LHLSIHPSLLLMIFYIVFIAYKVSFVIFETIRFNRHAKQCLRGKK
jgi:hypothetical protein